MTREQLLAKRKEEAKANFKAAAARAEEVKVNTAPAAEEVKVNTAPAAEEVKVNTAPTSSEEISTEMKIAIIFPLHYMVYKVFEQPYQFFFDQSNSESQPEKKVACTDEQLLDGFVMVDGKCESTQSFDL